MHVEGVQILNQIYYLLVIFEKFRSGYLQPELHDRTILTVGWWHLGHWVLKQFAGISKYTKLKRTGAGNKRSEMHRKILACRFTKIKKQPAWSKVMNMHANI
jgi:hypothetical protein